MGLQIEKRFTVRAPRSAVWAFLTDPYRVASCLPGAAIVEKVDGTTFVGTMTVKLGPVTAGYRGKLHFERLDEAAGEAELTATGQETRGKGGADMRMKSRVVERGPAETEVTVISDVNVMGVLAQFGRGMIQDVSDQLFQKFTEAMRRQLETPATAAAPAAPTVARTPAAPAASSTAPTAPWPAPDASGSAAASGGSAPAPAPSIGSAPAPAIGSAPLEVGALGAAAAGRAAARTLRRPGFWAAIAALVFVVYWWFFR